MPRTTHRSKSGKKLYAKRNKQRQFTDIQNVQARARTGYQAQQQKREASLFSREQAALN
jgi:hypothetical protein